MIAVILAGGKGTRFGDIAKTTPKSLITVGGKKLIYHVLDSLPLSVSCCVIVIGHLGELIKKEVGERYKNIDILYVEQLIGGTGGALMSAKHFLKTEKMFLAVSGDDIFGEKELEKLIGDSPSYGIFYGMPNKPMPQKISFDSDFILTGFTSTQDLYSERFYGVGAYYLPNSFFEETLYQLKNGEMSLPHTLVNANFKLKVAIIYNWLPVNNLEEKEKAENLLYAMKA